jgi:protein-glutamine gamma-glutamyltransferase
MNAPIGLLGAALALWGFSIGAPVAGLLLGSVVEIARHAPASTAAAAKLVWVIRIVALVALAKFAYVAVTSPFPQALYTWLRWLPVILLPLPLAQVLAGGAIPGDTITRALRPGKSRAEDNPDWETKLDVSYAYAGITLIAAATGPASEAWFYFAAAFIVAWALVTRMPRKGRPAGAALVVVAAALGLSIHLGLSQLQGQVEDWSTDMLQEFFAAKPDAFRERTRIGDLGRIKLSDRIVMRVIPEGAQPASLLLREAAFDSYYNGEWRSSQRAFRPVPREGDRWKLRDGAAARALTLRRSISGGEGLLALPAGAHLVERLPAESLELLPTGTVRAKGIPRFLAIGVRYDEERESEPPLVAGDLDVPVLLAPALDEVLASAQIVQAAPRETVAAVQRFFAERFSYSLELSNAKGTDMRTVADFLLRDQKGHCEYFATGTVLLLRRAGIPARYVVGYSAQEYSGLESAFIVRNRHAHAWASAYVDGRWIAVDTTPSRWADDEGKAARSIFGPAMDVFSWVLERVISAWLDRSPGELVRALALAMGVLAFLPAAIILTREWRRYQRQPRTVPNRIASAWHTLESRLARQGFVRERGETALAWARRLRRENQFERWRGELVELAQAYYRARFDPSAAPADRDEFIRTARAWKNEP